MSVDYRAIAASTEKTSDDFLAVNHCGIEVLSETDRGSFRPGGRVDYHILYVERGVCHCTVGGTEQDVSAGGVILYRPGEPQKYYYLASEHSISHYFHFTGIGCAALLDKLGIAALTVFDMGKSEHFEDISCRMVREFTMKKPFYENCCAAYLYQLLTVIARKYALRSGNISRESEARINNACSRIYENLKDPPQTAELAAACFLSESRFTHLFREVTGQSVLSFTKSLRIDRAKELLSSTRLPVHEVAEAVGYTDQNYFSRHFREQTGVSPSAFRKEENTASDPE